MVLSPFDRRNPSAPLRRTIHWYKRVMDASNLATLHRALGDALAGNVSWTHSEQLPLWVKGASTWEIGRVGREPNGISVFAGPWLGYRLLGRAGEGWRCARLLPGPRVMGRRPSPYHLAHRLARSVRRDS